MGSGADTSSIVKVGVAAVALLVAGVLALRLFGASHEIGDRAFYFDESEAKLYVGPAGQYPPLRGIGGAPEDGVSAMVYVCTEDASKDDRRIAYLQKYTPELIAELEKARREHDEQGSISEPIDRRYMSAQTLVRRVDEDQWHPQSSPEGQAIIAVLTQRCENGNYPRLCSPDE